MIFAALLVETAPGAAPRVAARLLREPALALQGGDGDRRIAAVFTGEDAAALAALAERLVREDAEVTGVFPTRVTDGPDAATRASATASLRRGGSGEGGGR